MAIEAWTSYPLLSAAQVEGYLRRLELNPTPLPLSSKYLRELQFSHTTKIPFDTSRMHLPKSIGCNADNVTKPFQWGAGPGLNIDVQDLYYQVVELRRGGYCFANNGLFAALLRTIGFSVSQVGARVYMLRNQDPKDVGYNWTGGTNHQALIVSIPGEEGHWLCDVGFGGGGPPYPVPLVNQATIESITDDESFLLVKESLPGTDDTFLPMPDTEFGWTLYRGFEKGFKTKKEKFHSPLYHFVNLSCTQMDWDIVNFYTSKCPLAFFGGYLCVSKLLPSGQRWSLVIDKNHDAEFGQYYSKDGTSGEIENIQKVPLTEGSIWEILSTKFDFLPDHK